MSDIPASEPVVATVKVAPPSIKGVIVLADGRRLEFSSHFTYFLARAFYSKLEGAIVLAVCSAGY